MKIRTKIILYIVGCLLTGVVSAIFAVSRISLPYIETEERTNIQSNIDKASLVLESDIQVVERTQRDWTCWDDTYNFVKGEDNNYIDDNLGKATLEQLNLVGMLYFDKNENNIYAEYQNENYKSAVKSEIGQKDNLRNLLKGVNEKHIKSGITIINKKLFIVSIAGITTTDGLTSFDGYLIMIKELDGTYIDYLGKLMEANIRYYQGTSNHSDNFSGISLVNINRRSNSIQYEGSANDILNDNSIIFEAVGNRHMYENAVKTLITASSALVIAFLFISFITILLVEKREVNRILYLTKFVQDIINKKDINLRLVVDGQDEIASLGNNINCMLEELEKSHLMEEKHKEHLHLIMEAINDGYFDYSISNGKIEVSRAWLEYLGYRNIEDTQIKIETVVNDIFHDEQDDFRKVIDEYLLNNNTNFYKEIRAYKAGHGYIWVLVRGRVIEYDKDGKPTRFMGSLSDITETKENERKNIYLLQTDTVTKLKNRAFMEDRIKELGDKRIIDFCVIMADVNGLKLMNDAFGHKQGDRLLRTVGEIIKLCCSDTDVPVRWGGDEFLILIQNNRQYADKLMKKIRNEFNLINSFPIKISVAMGCSSHKESDVGIEQVICRSEEKMYRNKLLESRSFHNGVIASFEQTLYEKQIETLENINYRKKICHQMGKFMKLSPEVMDELDLLNLLHDVGKIAMPDYIILKKDSLTDEELNIRKKHSESGYRIAKAIPEIAHIADSILYHHENFDGSGYPTGIAGETIPMNSRIFAVIGFYDSLVDGVNLEPAKLEMVKQEIEKKSGKQFDSDVVNVFLKIINQ